MLDRPVVQLFSRRQVLKGFADTAGLGLAASALAACAPAAPGPPASQPAAPPTAATTPAAGSQGTIVYWVYDSRHKASDQIRKQTADAWAVQHGYTVQASYITATDLNKKLPAAIEARQTPDIMDAGQSWMLRLVEANLLVDVSDVVTMLGDEQGGWVGKALTYMTAPDGRQYMVMYGYSGNSLIARDDLAQEAGLTMPPATWADLMVYAQTAQKPPRIFGYAQQISNHTKSSIWQDIAKSYGVRIADEKGERPVVGDFRSTFKEFVALVEDAYRVKKIFPPGLHTADNAWNNDQYQSEKAVFITSPPNVGLWLRENKPDLLRKTGWYAFPRGPKAHIHNVGAVGRMLVKGSKNIDALKALLHYTMNITDAEEHYRNSWFGPVLKAQLGFEMWKQGWLKGLYEMAHTGSPSGFPDVFNAAYAEQTANTTLSKMLQRILVDHWTFDQAFDEFVDMLNKIYARYKK